MSSAEGLATVPNGILQMILSYVVDGETRAEVLGAVSIVSKKFKSVAESNSLWRPVAEKYFIPVDITGPTSVKEQLKNSIVRANILWHKLQSLVESKRESGKPVAVCASLASYPFQTVWDKTLSLEWFTKSCFLLQNEALSDCEIMMIILQICCSLKKIEVSKDESSFALNRNMFIEVIRHIVVFNKFYLIKNITEALLRRNVAGKLAIFLHSSTKENPLILCDKTTVEQLWSIIPDIGADSSLRPKLYEKLAKSKNIFICIQELQNSLSRDSSEILPLLLLKIAKYLMYTSREWPNPEIILADTLEKITGTGEREAVRVLLQPLFNRYNEEYKKLKAESDYKTTQ